MKGLKKMAAVLACAAIAAGVLQAAVGITRKMTRRQQG